MKAFSYIFFSIISILFFGWIALLIGGADVNWVDCLGFGMTATVLTLILKDKINKRVGGVSYRISAALALL